MTNTVMVLEDEKDIRDILVFSLEQAGYKTLQAATSEKALSMLNDQESLDLMLVDWMLPGASGLEFTRRVKRSSKFSDTPIIMLTAREEEEDKIKGLDIGADDYVTKPFSIRELMARIHAHIRRTKKSDEIDEVFEAGLLRLDTASHRVTVKGKNLKLGPTEYKILHYFLANQERVFSRSQLMDAIWGHLVIVEERTVDVYIRRLRKTFEKYDISHYIQTVRGAGYRFSSKN